MMPCTTLTVRPAPPPPPPPPPPPAALKVTDISVSPSEVEVGRPIEILVTAKNQGGEAGSAFISITVNGEEIGRLDTKLLEPGATVTLSLIWTPPRTGTFRACAEVV